MPQPKITLKDFLAAVDAGMMALHVDTETSLAKAYVWGCGKQFVGHDQIIPGSETKIMSVQYKFEGDTEVHGMVADWIEHEKFASLNAKLKKQVYKIFGVQQMKFFGILVLDDSRILEDFVVNVLSKAHMLVGQNLNSFDYKVMNDRMMNLQLTPLNLDLSIDILKLSRQSFRKISHRLDFRSKMMGLGGKHRMERQDWIDILEGVTQIEDKMLPYGLKDVDDEQAILHKEFNYYKRLPVKVEKTIHTFMSPVKDTPYCIQCSNRHKPKFKIRVTEHKLETKYRCLNCYQKWSVPK